MATVSLKGSRRELLHGSRVVSAADAAERFEVSVIVRRRSAQTMKSRVTELGMGGASHVFLSREEFTRHHGADPADMAKVRQFAAAHGVSVLQEHAGRRTLVLAATVAQFSAAFGVELHHVEHDGGTYRGRTGEIFIPAELQDIVEAVLGLDDRPQAKTHFRLRPQGAIRHAGATPASFSPTQLAALYGYPAGDGSGQCVALIELGGGYKPADLATYFTGLGVSAPTVLAVSVDQGKNAPTGDGNGPDGEVMLDIEVVGAIVPKATIAVYFAPNTDAGFLDAITTAIHDTTHKPSVISISWGGPESSWTDQAMTAMDEAFQAAATMGITVCVASGDNGSSDGASGGGDHVDFPASSPYALACGGTNLRATSNTVAGESVWNDGSGGGATGGGVSNFFPLPTWQQGLKVNRTGGAVTALAMRGVPDVCADADPETGYDVRVDGTDTVIGGTSAVAPLWAALIARINQHNGRSSGLIQPQLYKNPQALRDVTEGNNGDFAAVAAWDACTGLGSPNGAAVLGVL